MLEIEKLIVSCRDDDRERIADYLKLEGRNPEGFIRTVGYTDCYVGG